MKQKKPEHPTCPMFGDSCRHVSLERSMHPYTKLKIVNGIYAPDKLGYAIHELGAYCNNYNCWVCDMHYCPVRWEHCKRGNPIRKRGRPRKWATM